MSTRSKTVKEWQADKIAFSGKVKEKTTIIGDKAYGAGRDELGTGYRKEEEYKKKVPKPNKIGYA